MGTTLEEFTLFSLFKCAELNSSKQLAKKALAGILFLVSAVSSVWCSEYIYNENCESTEVYDFSSGIIAGNSEFVWKKLNAAGTAWEYLTTPETPGASDNLYFTGELAANIKLDADVTVNDIIFSYERTANPNVTSGSYTITIDLNGYNLTCNDFIFNNASTYPANVVIKDSSGSPGTLTINGTLDYSDNLNHTLTISDDVAIDASGATYSAGNGTGRLTVSGSGTFELPAGTEDEHLTISGVSTNAVSVLCSATNTDRSSFTSAKSSTITFTCPPTHLPIVISYTIVLSTPFDNPVFSFNGSSLSEGTNTGTITLAENAETTVAVLSYAETFGGADSISVEFKNGTKTVASNSIEPDNPYWTGSVDTAWNNVANWVGITDITVLDTASKIYIPAEASREPEAGGDLTAGSGTTEFYIGKNISSTGSMTFNGSIILDGNITLTSLGAMTFKGSINSTPSAAASSLILDAGAQITVNNGPIGSTNPIGDLTVKNNYESTGDSPITCSGALVFENPCLFTSDMTAASFSIGDECTLSSTGSLLTITTTSGDQSFEGEVLLLSDVQLITPDNGSVTFRGNVESHPYHKSSLTVGNTSGTAKTNLSVATSCGNTNPLNDLYVSGNFTAGEVKVDGNFTSKNSTSVSSIIVGGNSTVGGTVSATGSGGITFTGDTTLTGDTIFDATSVTFSGEVDSDGNNLTIGTNSNATTATFAGNVIHTSTLTLYGNTTLSGAVTINVNDWANPSSKTITPGTSTVTVKDSITGSNNFYNLTTTGTALAFEAGKTQTISGTFTADGTSLESSTAGTQWVIDVASASAVVSNVSVKDSSSVNLITPTGTNANLGNNINWDISSTYRWNGSNTDWKTAANWLAEYSAGTWTPATEYPGQFATHDIVTIATPNSYWPDFSGTAELNLSSLTVGSGASDTTAEFTVSASNDILLSAATPITNYGTIIYSGTGRIKNNASTPALIMDVARGTVQYNAGAVVIDNTNTGNDYYNLTVDGTGHTLGGAITVANNFTLKTSSSITDGTSLEVKETSAIGGNITTTGTQDYKGIVTAAADCTFTSSGGNVTFSNKIEATGYNVASSTNGGSVSTTIRGNITAANFDVTGILNFGQNLRTITTTGSQNYRGPAKINSANASQTLTLTAAGGVTFYDTLTRFNNTTTTAVLYTAGTTNVVFKKNISDLAEISIDGTTTFENTVSSVSTLGAQTYTGAVTYASDITFAAGSGNTTEITCGNSFTDSSATPHNLTVNKGNFKIGTSTFTAGVVTVDSAGAFTQTGDNGTNTQSALALINNGTMIWDSTGAGGTLSVTGTATAGGISSPDGTDYTDHLIVFNKKNVNISNDNTISGVFYNLTIPTGKTYTNGLEIVVRNNFTATGTYAHNSKTLRFGDTKVGSVTYPNGDDGIITGTESGTPSTLYLGNILIRQGNKTKTFKSNISTANITCGDTTTGGSIIFEKNLTVNGNPSLTTKGSYIFNSTADGTTVNFTNNVSITNAAKVTVGKNFTSSGNITINAPVSLSANTTFTATGKNIAFGDTVSKDTTSSTLTVTTGTGTSSQVTFTKAVNVQQLEVTNYGTFNLKKAASITAPAGFRLSGNGNAVIGEDSDTTALSITTTNTPILFDGTGTVTLNGTGLKTFSTSNSDGGNITINKAIAGSANNSQPLTLTAGTGTGAGNITLSNNIGTATIALGNLTLTGKNITLDSGKKIYARSVSVTNTGAFHLQSAASITAGSGFTKTGTGLSQLNGTIATTNSAISFNTDTYISGTSTLNAGSGTITIGNGTAGDLYISSISGTTAQNVSFTAGTLDVKGNFALFNGNVTLAANLTTGKDIVLLNGASSTMNDDTHDTNKSSGITGLFNYHNALRTASNKLCPPSLALATTSGYPETMPDGVTSITHTGTYKSTLTGFGGKTITAGQNFYDNGVNLSPTSAWTLKLKDNDSAVNAFAEMYNAGISRCTAACITTNGYAWLSAAENCTNGGNNSSTDTSATISYSGGDTGAYTRTKTGVAFLRPTLSTNNTLRSASEGRTTGPEIPNLSGTYTVRDNVIRIEFVRNNDASKNALIENSNNEISRAIQSTFKTNNGSASFTANAYIDAECTVSTDGKGDLAVIYIKADTITWNLAATGTSTGDATSKDSHGNHQTALPDLTIEKALTTMFYTLTDEHKNRICSFKSNPTSTPSSAEGFRFTATATRCAIAEMHITFAIADFNSNKIYLYFDRPLADDITWETFNPGTVHATEDAIKIITAPGSTTSVNTVTSVSRDGISNNGIILYLQNDLDYSMITYGITIAYAGSFLFQSKIHSPDNHVVENGESHCISDVITNCVDVQYAYDNRNDAYIASTGGTAPIDSIVMRNFTGSGSNDKVFEDKNITLVTRDISNSANFTYKLVADITPNPSSEGLYYKDYTGHSTRFWFAEGNNPVLQFSPALNNSSEKKNSSTNSNLIEQTIDTTDPDLITYLFHNFSEETPCLNWEKGSNVRFVFEVLNGGTPYTINHRYDTGNSETTPLYAVRLKNPSDPGSIDLWSFRISEPSRQSGGVSVYSNVVNATNKEFCTVEVNMSKKGNLRVIVMTADGNVVKYLENGIKPEGLHYYYWNGTNNSGKAVARGIYFIRVVGPEMEETRKVMVVK
ncbi:MAG: hypothetical protein J6Y36_00540 [Treponema sp.]|nr:hypothetical protein [Treponema sp.]